MTDTHLLKYFIHKNGDTIETLAAAMTLRRPTLSAKINNKADFKQREMFFIKARYKLSAETFLRLFMGGEDE